MLLLPEFLPDLVEDDAVVFSFNDLQIVIRTPRPRTLLDEPTWQEYAGRPGTSNGASRRLKQIGDHACTADRERCLTLISPPARCVAPLPASNWPWAVISDAWLRAGSGGVVGQTTTRATITAVAVASSSRPEIHRAFESCSRAAARLLIALMCAMSSSMSMSE